MESRSDGWELNFDARRLSIARVLIIHDNCSELASALSVEYEAEIARKLELVTIKIDPIRFQSIATTHTKVEDLVNL
jgi:hypothetical protein